MRPFFASQEHDQFRAATRRFVASALAPHVEEWENSGIPRSVFVEAGAIGLIGARYPEALGGADGGLLAAIPVVEEISRCRSGGFVTSYLVQAHISTPILLHLGTREQHEEFLRPAIRGERIGCLAVTEPGAGSDVSAICTRARKDGGDWVLNGAKMYITNGGIADFSVLAAKTDEGPGHRSTSLFLVDTHQPGYQPSKPLNKLGLRASNTVGISLEDVRVPARNLLGQDGAGFRYIMEGFQEERLVSSVYGYASALQAIEDTVAYLHERPAFGAPLAERQAIRHTLAQLATELEAVRQLCYATAWKLHRGEDATREVSMCKLLSAETANRVAYQAMQFHGGFGYMEECPIARYYRDVRLYSIGGGASEIMREIISKRLFGGPSTERGGNRNAKA
jgi:alkylation response protein AidB-like acyl-CoA dehydrogenase